MSRLDEQLTEQFHQWERRGRGWQVFEEPVCPEPPFRPFEGHYQSATPAVDDGVRPTFLSSLMQKLSGKLSTEAAGEARHLKRSVRAVPFEFVIVPRADCI